MLTTRQESATRRLSDRSPYRLTWLVWLWLALGCQSCLAVEWPGWRGVTRDGRVPHESWPTSLGENALSLLWEIPLDPSYSGPVIGKGRVYVTETVGEKSERVRSIDTETGEEKWRKEWTGSMKVPFFARSNGSWIRSTPTLDRDRLFVAGMRDVLVCLDARDGREIWRVDFPERFDAPLPSFGLVCSPLVLGDAVFLQAGASLVRLHRDTGDTVWRSLQDSGGMHGSAFSSPVESHVAGTRQLLVQTRREMAGVAIDSGKVLWSREVEAFRGMNILTPMTYQNLIFTSTYGGGTHVFRLTAKDSGHEVNDVWKNPAQGYMSSPVFIDGYAYLHLRNQRMTCFEIATGERKWTTSDRFGKYMSMITNGELILALDERGLLLLLKPNPEKFDLVDSREVSASSTWAHVAISGDSIYVRSLDALKKFRWKGVVFRRQKAF